MVGRSVPLSPHRLVLLLLGLAVRVARPDFSLLPAGNTSFGCSENYTTRGDDDRRFQGFRVLCKALQIFVPATSVYTYSRLADSGHVDCAACEEETFTEAAIKDCNGRYTICNLKIPNGVTVCSVSVPFECLKGPLNAKFATTTPFSTVAPPNKDTRIAEITVLGIVIGGLLLCVILVILILLGVRSNLFKKKFGSGVQCCFKPQPASTSLQLLNTTPQGGATGSCPPVAGKTGVNYSITYEEELEDDLYNRIDDHLYGKLNLPGLPSNEPARCDTDYDHITRPHPHVTDSGPRGHRDNKNHWYGRLGGGKTVELPPDSGSEYDHIPPFHGNAKNLKPGLDNQGMDDTLYRTIDDMQLNESCSQPTGQTDAYDHILNSRPNLMDLPRMNRLTGTARPNKYSIVRNIPSVKSNTSSPSLRHHDEHLYDELRGNLGQSTSESKDKPWVGTMEENSLYTTQGDDSDVRHPAGHVNLQENSLYNHTGNLDQTMMEPNDLYESTGSAGPSPAPPDDHGEQTGGRHSVGDNRAASIKLNENPLYVPTNPGVDGNAKLDRVDSLKMLENSLYQSQDDAPPGVKYKLSPAHKHSLIRSPHLAELDGDYARLSQDYSLPTDPPDDVPGGVQLTNNTLYEQQKDSETKSAPINKQVQAGKGTRLPHLLIENDLYEDSQKVSRAKSPVHVNQLTGRQEMSPTKLIENSLYDKSPVERAEAIYELAHPVASGEKSPVERGEVIYELAQPVASGEKSPVERGKVIYELAQPVDSGEKSPTERGEAIYELVKPTASGESHVERGKAIYELVKPTASGESHVERGNAIYELVQPVDSGEKSTVN